MPRLLISRSNEALIHKGSPTGWDFNEDIKVVSSRDGTGITRYAFFALGAAIKHWESERIFFFFFYDEPTPLIL